MGEPAAFPRRQRLVGDAITWIGNGNFAHVRMAPATREAQEETWKRRSRRTRTRRWPGSDTDANSATPLPANGRPVALRPRLATSVPLRLAPPEGEGWQSERPRKSRLFVPQLCYVALWVVRGLCQQEGLVCSPNVPVRRRTGIDIAYRGHAATLGQRCCQSCLTATARSSRSRQRRATRA